MNAFEQLKLPALSSTNDLRRVNEQARIRQTIAGSGTADATAQVADRLIRDPEYRLIEAAAWYFEYRTIDEACAADDEDLNPHDWTLSQWHLMCDEVDGEDADADGNGVDLDEFKEACASTVELLNNPAAWQPLQVLISEINDPRLDSGDVVRVAQQAAARWISQALFGLAAQGVKEIQAAGETILECAALPDPVIDIASKAVLHRAADEVTSACAAFESRSALILKRLDDEQDIDPTIVRTLQSAAEELITDVKPWAELVDVFDEDPDSGEEGRALDRAGSLLRSVSVELANRRQEFSMAQELVESASGIAQSSSLRASLEEDLRRLRFVEALSSAAEAIQAGLPGRAETELAKVVMYAKTDEELAETSRLRLVVLAMRGTAPVARSRAGSAWGSIVGIAMLVLVVGGIVARVADSSGGGGSSSSGSAPAFNAPINANPVGVSDSSQGARTSDNSSFWEVERAAIEVERARLETVEIDLNSLQSRIDDLKRSLDLTETSYPNGAPAYVIAQYDSDVQTHNRLVREYNSMLSDYKRDLIALNARIDVYNSR